MIALIVECTANIPDRRLRKEIQAKLVILGLHGTVHDNNVSVRYEGSDVSTYLNLAELFEWLPEHTVDLRV